MSESQCGLSPIGITPGLSLVRGEQIRNAKRNLFEFLLIFLVSCPVVGFRPNRPWSPWLLNTLRVTPSQLPLDKTLLTNKNSEHCKFKVVEVGHIGKSFGNVGTVPKIKCKDIPHWHIIEQFFTSSVFSCVSIMFELCVMYAFRFKLVNLFELPQVRLHYSTPINTWHYKANPITLTTRCKHVPQNYWVT